MISKLKLKTQNSKVFSTEMKKEALKVTLKLRLRPRDTKINTDTETKILDKKIDNNSETGTYKSRIVKRYR